VQSRNLTTFIHSSTGPVVYLFASHHEAPGFNPQRVTYVKPGFSCLRCRVTQAFLFSSIIKVLLGIQNSTIFVIKCTCMGGRG
jgi:hypothetical protein